MTEKKKDEAVVHEPEDEWFIESLTPAEFHRRRQLALLQARMLLELLAGKAENDDMMESC